LTRLALPFALEENGPWTGLCAALVIVTKPTGIIPFLLGMAVYGKKRLETSKQSGPSILMVSASHRGLVTAFYDFISWSGHPLAFLDAMTALGRDSAIRLT